MSDSKRVNLFDVANRRFETFLSRIPADVYRQLVDNLSWTEKVGDEEIQFDVILLEDTLEYLHIGVGMSVRPTVMNPFQTGCMDTEVSSSYILKFAADGSYLHDV